jgi:AraC family transcriptional regulator, dual regulator of chb operon
MDHLRFDDFVSAGDACHFARARIVHPRPRRWHDHDFAEVFWVESGAGWHWINRDKRPLRRGVTVFVRPADAHAFSRTGSVPLVFHNMAFQRSAWDQLRKRYGLDDLFGTGNAGPREATLSGQAWNEVQLASTDLRTGRRDLLALDRMLLTLAGRAGSTTGPRPTGPAMPTWLARALDTIASPEHFVDGTRGLAALAGRSPEHVSRAVKRYLGKTPTDVVNDAKLQIAVDRLTSSDDNVLDVALDSGFVNLSHFYKVFAARFGTTPREYRMSQRRIVAER